MDYDGKTALEFGKNFTVHPDWAATLGDMQIDFLGDPAL
jgi:hypothetical protein